MATRIKASSKGQFVLPKRIRERLGITAGTELDVIDTASGVELRPAKPPGALTVEEAVQRLRATVKYHGPRLDEADWQRGIGEAVEEKWGRGAG